MRTSIIALVLTCGVGGPPPAPVATNRPRRQVGREAYDASQDVEHGAKTAARELKEAGKEFREGWSERRKEDKRRGDPPPAKKNGQSLATGRRGGGGPRPGMSPLVGRRAASLGVQSLMPR